MGRGRSWRLCRIEHRMRRGLSIVLVLLLWLSPLAATLGADAEQRLPACCRRHGEHHCAMSAPMASAIAQADQGSALGAPSRCPLFPRFTATMVGPVHATMAPAIALPHDVEAARAADGYALAATLRFLRARASRGPPASLLS